MPKKKAQKPKSKRRTRTRKVSLLSEQGKAIESKIEEIVNKEIAEHRLIPRKQINTFLARLLPSERVKSPEEILDNFEITESVIFTPQQEMKENIVTKVKMSDVEYSGEYDNEEPEDTVDEVSDDTDTESEQNTIITIDQEEDTTNVTKTEVINKNVIEKSLQTNLNTNILQNDINNSIKGVRKVMLKQQMSLNEPTKETTKTVKISKSNN